MGNFTTEELYEQAKRILRRACEELGIEDKQNRPFILVCGICGFPFRNDIEVGMVGEHASLAHDVNTDNEKVNLDLVFIGEGPPPRGT